MTAAAAPHQAVALAAHVLCCCSAATPLCCHAPRYALTGKEVKMILMQRLVKVDGKVRTDATYPAGFMDVIELEKTGEFFR